jgi:hypothetical protein
MGVSSERRSGRGTGNGVSEERKEAEGELLRGLVKVEED